MLVRDPCSLLDPVRDEDQARFLDLARDHDGQGGLISDASRCEARVALTLEYQGILDGPLCRPRWGEARDRHGRPWDFKQPRSERAIHQHIADAAAKAGMPPPPNVKIRGAYDLRLEIERVRFEQECGFGVVVDLRRLELDQALELVAALDSDPDIDLSLLRYFPNDLSAFAEEAS